MGRSQRRDDLPCLCGEIVQADARRSYSVRARGTPTGDMRGPLYLSLGHAIFRWIIPIPGHATVAPLQGNRLAIVEENPEVAPAGDPVPVEVQTFDSPFGKARAVIFSDGTPWFVAKDVCEGLGLSGGSMSTHMGRLKPEQKQVIELSSCSTASIRDALYAGRGASRLMLISRGGFNDLVLESRKPVAREYRQWVTDEVLPALQDTGTFTDKRHPVGPLNWPPFRPDIWA